MNCSARGIARVTHAADGLLSEPSSQPDIYSVMSPAPGFTKYLEIHLLAVFSRRCRGSHGGRAAAAAAFVQPDLRLAYLQLQWRTCTRSRSRTPTRMPVQAEVWRASVELWASASIPAINCESRCALTTAAERTRHLQLRNSEPLVATASDIFGIQQCTVIN